MGGWCEKNIILSSKNGGFHGAVDLYVEDWGTSLQSHGLQSCFIGTFRQEPIGRSVNMVSMADGVYGRATSSSF